jgi:cell division protein FtsQ
MSQALLNKQQSSRWPLGVIILSSGVVCVVIIVLTYISFKLVDPKVLPITKIIVSPLNAKFVNLEAKNLAEIVEETLTDRGFFHINVRAVQTEMLRQPWVSKAIVKRSWRDKLIIQIREQRPVARWGEKELLNEKGEVFSPDFLGKAKTLVRLTGPVGTQKIMLEHYKVMSARLEVFGLGVSEVLLTDRRAWTLYTDDGKALVMGRDDILNRLQRFLIGYPKELAARWSEVNKVDLRYSNGLAVLNKKIL